MAGLGGLLEQVALSLSPHFLLESLAQMDTGGP